MNHKHQIPGLFLPLSALLLFTLAGCDKNNNGPEGDPPVASFIFSSNRTLVGNGISFTDKSTNGPESWLWIFDDGATSEEQNPVHTYTAAGAYYVKLAAGNQFGTDTFTSISSIRAADTVYNDIQGNTYKVIQIGKQVWMAENLNIVTGIGSWAYNNDLALAEEYGRLYDWETACTVCPTGWHLPSDEEWKELELFIGVPSNELDEDGDRGAVSGKLKEKGNTHWSVDMGDVTNSTGFTALPAGNYDGYSSTFSWLEDACSFWTSSTGNYDSEAWERRLISVYNTIGRYSIDKKSGNSVRCLKD